MSNTGAWIQEEDDEEGFLFEVDTRFRKEAATSLIREGRLTEELRNSYRVNLYLDYGPWREP
jgi:hypothetical protein